MTTKMRRIAVLLTVHNRKQSTIQCLTQLFSQTIPSDCDICVYMTDDGCTDGTPKAVKEQFPQVHIIKGDGNLFWNRGMWTAWEAAAKAKDYDYYLWLNDDTYISKDAIQILLSNSLEKHNSAIIVGATQSKETGECTYGLHDAKTGKLIVPNGTLQRGTNMNGNCVLIPKYVYATLGYLDPYYHHAGGDTDYGLRAEEQSIDVHLSSDYIGYCEQHPSLSIWCNPEYPLLQRWKALNKPTGMPLKILFYHEKKHNGVITAAFHVLTTLLHSTIPQLWTIKKYV